MLTGEDLISFVKENPTLSQKDLAREAGYTRTTEGGKEQVLSKKFYQQLLAAKGVPLNVGKAPGKAACYETTVHASGVILLGKTYVEQFGVKPGDVMAIQLDDDAIRLVPKEELVAA